MEIAPAMAHAETGACKKFAPLGQRPDLFPNIGLVRAGIESQARRQKPCIRYEQNEYCPRFRHSDHLAQRPVGIQEMFQRAET